MGDAADSLPSSKKRAAGREISRDNPGLDDDEEGSNEQGMGTFKRASDDVMAGRRIVKVRRNQNASSSNESTPSNPFARICLVPATVPIAVATEVVARVDKDSEGEKNGALEETEEGQRKTDEPVVETTKVDENAENKENNVIEEVKEPLADSEKPVEDEVSGGDKAIIEDTGAAKTNTEKPVEDKASGGDSRDEPTIDDVGAAKTDSEHKEVEEFQEEDKDKSSENIDPKGEGSAVNSFQQLSSTTNAFTGLAGTGFSTSTFTFGSVATDSSATGNGGSVSFGFNAAHNGTSSLFGTAVASIGSKSEGSGFPTMKEVPLETGEENEKTVFSADSVLFEFLEGAWKERGKGEIKVNVSTTESERARLVMRTRGNLRLVLNASLYPDMKLTKMDKRGITFACMNTAGESNPKDTLSTFALKFKDGTVEEFHSAVTRHTGNIMTRTPDALRTTENSSKASDE